MLLGRLGRRSAKRLGRSSEMRMVHVERTMLQGLELGVAKIGWVNVRTGDLLIVGLGTG